VRRVQFIDVELASMGGDTEEGFTVAFPFVGAEQCLMLCVSCFCIEDTSIIAVLELAIGVNAIRVGRIIPVKTYLSCHC